MKRIQIFLVNAGILTATSLLISSAGVWFNLYISEKLGAVGMGVFQLMMSVYSLTVTLASSGINLAATRLVAEETIRGGAGGRAAMRRCLAYSLFFGSLAGCALFFGANWVGTNWLHNEDTIRPLMVMALSMPLIGMSCALTGYFTAVRRVAKSAASQILESFLKITLTIFALTFLMPEGLEHACLAITLSGVIAEGASFLFAYALYRVDSRRHQTPGAPSRGLTVRLLGIALPVALSSYLRSGLATVKNLLVPVRLQAGSVAAGDSFAMFGLVHGVALPVITFPYAFLNAFNALIVPELAQSHSQHQNVSRMIERMFQLTLFCAFGVCGVLFAFPHEIGAMVSQNPDTAVYIRLLAPVIPVMYLDTAVDNMLKGLNEQLSVMRYNVIDAFLSMLMVYALLPFWGIKGYIIVICLSEVFNFSLSVGRLIKVTQFRFDLTERVVKPVLCIAIAVLVSRILMRGVPAAFLPLMRSVLLCGFAGSIYTGLLFLCGYFKRG